jgi:anti-anti-sigma regulatory factor
VKPAALSLAWHCDGDANVLTLRGVLGPGSGDVLLDALRRGPAPASTPIVVDLGRVTLDRAGAIALLDAYVATILRGGTMTLTGVSADARLVAQRAGVFDVMRTVEHRAAAVPSLESAVHTASGRRRETSMTVPKQKTTAQARLMLAELNQLIAALDRRVPRLESAGEAQIARDAADLRERALSLIHRIEGENPAD